VLKADILGWSIPRSVAAADCVSFLCLMMMFGVQALLLQEARWDLVIQDRQIHCLNLQYSLYFFSWFNLISLYISSAIFSRWQIRSIA